MIFLCSRLSFGAETPEVLPSGVGFAELYSCTRLLGWRAARNVQFLTELRGRVVTTTAPNQISDSVFLRLDFAVRPTAVDRPPGIAVAGLAGDQDLEVVLAEALERRWLSE